MGASKIEQLIEDIYEFVESCRMQPLSSTKVIVPKDELYDLLDELRLRTPDEIKRYQKIIANRDAIIADAEKKAEKILADTKEKAKELLNEHEIMQQAYYEANEMIMQASQEAERLRREAKEEAEQIRTGVLMYSNEVLSKVERVLAEAYEAAVSRYEGFINALENNLNIIKQNRQELMEQLYPENNTPQDVEVSNDQNDDYNFDENTFLNDIEP
ncbi:MAG: ATP synthase F0 subunit B [Thermoanaerobacteraceae bacterium]|nr:ATP synthase F0 subunit B [Thermoanaerobacteraceae bacterium]